MGTLVAVSNPTTSQRTIRSGGSRRGGGRGGFSCYTMELRWIRSRRSNMKTSLKSKAPPQMIPIYISTHLSDINLEELRELYGNCSHSCHRFPRVDPHTGRVDEVIDITKLRIALSHSSVLLSIFCNPQHVNLTQTANSEKQKQKQVKGFVRGFLETVLPVTPYSGQLVGFGRAVSDFGLTASIYDVMVIPSLQGIGIGRIIVEKIVRILTARGIYDIAALCSEKERLFFKACGFGSDILGSTTMMYTRTVSSCSEGHQNQIVRRAGQKVLLSPPLKESSESSASLKTSKSELV
ncbi:hypothetical protein SLE2022_123210 [Rubroshorea leprosula]